MVCSMQPAASRVTKVSLSPTQEHARNLEARLAATEAQLEQLQMRQQKLDGRNQLLEKVVHIDKKRQHTGKSATVGSSITACLLQHYIRLSVPLAAEIMGARFGIDHVAVNYAGSKLGRSVCSFL